MKQEKKKKPKAEKEHKPNWREVWASVEDIQQFLSSKVMLRYNLVRGRTEIHWLSQEPVLREDERGLLNAVTLGRAFVDLGFEKKCMKHVRGYVVVRRSSEEMRSLRFQLAQAGTDGTDETAVF